MASRKETQNEGISREELLAIIDRAARDGQTELDLSQKGISELPEAIGRLTNLQELNLFGNQLTALPESIGRLTNLRLLSLDCNRLTALPEAIGRLTNLQQLSLSGNQLTALPEATEKLTKLQELQLDDNELGTFPEVIGKLINLQRLDCDGNGLTVLPTIIGQLEKLEVLYLDKNRLSVLPDSIGSLTNLQELHLSANQLTTLPVSLSGLINLQHLNLNSNPLEPALRSAWESGIDAVRAYLRSLAKPELREELYEAKLVLVGEGEVGKTTLLKALTHAEPREGEPTTHGVKIDVQALHLDHPLKEGVKIKFNAWDFGGQEVYRVTHQFFFSRRSIYLLVWEPRMGVQQCQVEDWLRLIRLRVGSDARVIIVSTHCRTGERIARIDRPVLERDFGDIIAGFHEVDSLVDDPETGEKVGIARLYELIAQAAGELEQMGMPFNRDWREARDELLQREETHIPYAEFAAVCARHGLDDISTRTLAELMHDLGYIVYYGDDERLKGDVVLKPEWLTKAIGFVLEDRATQEADGILPDNRLREIWFDHPIDGQTRFDPAIYSFFLRLMEKYDVSYRLEEGAASLVAQHVPQVRPALPWLPEEEPVENRRRIGMVCVMEEAPPGLMPWMIVRTHKYAHNQPCADGTAHQLHWQKGVFQCKPSHNEALLELRERELHLYAEAVWPEYFMDDLQRTLLKLITDNWPGLAGRYYFAVPCPERVNGRPCQGRFNIDALRHFLTDGDATIRCQACLKRQNIVELLYGFQVENIREQLARMETQLTSMRQGMEGLPALLEHYVKILLRAMASEAKSGPRLFTVEPVSGNWRRITNARYRLHLLCEGGECPHKIDEEGKGVYEFEDTRGWVRQIAPYANRIAQMLKTVLPLAGPVAGKLIGAEGFDQLGIAANVAQMTGVIGTLLEGDLEIKEHTRLRQGQDILDDAERSGVLALHALLRELDPHHERLGLTRVETYTGDYLWLCRTHYEQSQSKIPDKIE